MTSTDVIQQMNLGTADYDKPAVMLYVLRVVVLGAQRFDVAFREYVSRWAFKHPTPWDFFRTIENVSGENLGWFWKGWFLENFKLDQAIVSVNYENNEPTLGALVAIANLDQMAMPVIIGYETIS